MPRARVFSASVSTPAKTPVRIPLNDDRQEKVNRLHSRQAQHEVHMNQIKAAATPMRKRRSLLGQSPRTPGENDENELPSIGGSAVTPMKRVPILANFEEWMKMATDNKINATNSWNFALIDYFHDMSLLREGDGVNFQRASCTLDGCVKIYTNRVDSVATETSKLLSGLADSNSGKQNDEDDLEEGEDDGEDENGSKKRSKKRVQRSSETTLATSFAQLQLKKMELEFAIDPLFKKASADFDEGGAKGLLLNHLAIDGSGRIVFDSSDDVQEVAESQDLNDDSDASTEQQAETSTAMDLGGLAAKFLPDLSILDNQDICPSLKTFELGNGDASIDLPFLKAPDDWKQGSGNNSESPSAMSNPAPPAFDDDDNLLGGLDLADDVGFGEGGEAWAKEVALEPQLRPHLVDQDDEMYDSDGGGDKIHGENENARYTISMRHGAADEQQNILDYFDKALRSNWAGPEHWKIRKVKDAAKTANQGTIKRKEREPFEIDFLAPMSQQLADALYTPTPANSTISLPRAQWKSKTRNLLPDDKHFSSRQLLRLFLKPSATLGQREIRGSTRVMTSAPGGTDVDEAYWAQRQQEEKVFNQDEESQNGNYDANFFQDDGFNMAEGLPDDDDDEFADAREHFTPGAEIPVDTGNLVANATAAGVQDGAFGTQVVTQSRRFRPEYVQYARVATKVDVRRLKEEIWKGLAFEKIEAPSMLSEVDENKSLKFTDVVNGLTQVYAKQAMADISTSYCFICVLHLANEKGLVINNHEDFQELTIKKDHGAEIVGIEA